MQNVSHPILTLAEADDPAWTWWRQDHYPIVDNGRWFNGVIFARSEISFRHITDGLSKTYLVGEQNQLQKDPCENPDFYNPACGELDASLYQSGGPGGFCFVIGAARADDDVGVPRLIPSSQTLTAAPTPPPPSSTHPDPTPK